MNHTTKTVTLQASPKLKKLITLFFLLFPLISFCQPNMIKSPYVIHSDKASFTKALHQTTFNGHVVATHGNNIITGNKSILFLNKQNNQVKKILTYGNPATLHLMLKRNKERLQAKADIIKYDPIKERVTLCKNAIITRSGNTLKGNIIHLNLRDDVITTNNSKHSHNKTMIIIHPEQ